MSTEGKKGMLLGGNYFQMTATKAAKKLGCYVISVDYLPDNPAHKYADAYYNISTTDREAVLALAQKLHIDGIVSYASDVSAPTAAYIAEQFVQRKGRQIAGDAFVADGRIVYFGLANEHFDKRCNPLVPIGESFPADLSADMRTQAEKEVQRAFTELGYQNGAVNLDFMFLENGDIFIIELGPRNGGNLITDAIEAAGGVNLAEYTIKSALGEDLRDLKETNMGRFISSYIWHSHTDGIYDGICISDQLRRKILRSDIFAERGSRIHRFDHGGFGIGAALLAYDSMDEMLYMMDHMEQFYEVKLRKTDGEEIIES